MFEKAANDFSEGNTSLKELLKYCFENKIKTFGCCAGHNEQERPYIMSEFSNQNMKSILKLLKLISLNGDINELSFGKEPNVVSSLRISTQNHMADEGFKQILAYLQYDRDVELDELDENRQLIVKSMKSHSIPNSYLLIDENDNYISVFADKNYPFVSAKEYKKDSEELNKALKRLESNSKNYNFMKEYSYDKEKINEFFNGHNKNVIINAEATMERQHEYGELNVVVVEPFMGVTLEDFANHVMQLKRYGQGCITEFNLFRIDTRDYSSPEEIIQAYTVDYEKHRLNSRTGKIGINEVKDATKEIKISDIDDEYNAIKQQLKGKDDLSLENV